MQTAPPVFLIIGGLILLSFVGDGLFFWLLLYPVIQARKAGITLTVKDVATLRRRRIPPLWVVHACAAVRRSGRDLTAGQVAEVFATHRDRIRIKDDLARLAMLTRRTGS
jgi:uncharacterized protein YqfA (UPF0365 family)